jgi:small GTP-binding protein
MVSLLDQVNPSLSLTLRDDPKKRRPIVSASQFFSKCRACVRKTCLYTRLSGGIYYGDESSTVGASFSKISALGPDGVRYEIGLRDTAGQERSRTVVPLYFAQVDFVLAVYSVVDRASFAAIAGWVALAREKPDVVRVILIGNKCDLENAARITRDEAENMSGDIGDRGVRENNPRSRRDQGHNRRECGCIRSCVGAPGRRRGHERTGGAQGGWLLLDGNNINTFTDRDQSGLALPGPQTLSLNDSRGSIATSSPFNALWGHRSVEQRIVAANRAAWSTNRLRFFSAFKNSISGQQL